MHEFHYGVFIGRFQPLHLGHEAVIRGALERVETLIVVVGSSFMAPTPKNPLTFADREAMFKRVFAHELSTGRLILMPLYDYEHDYDWEKNLRLGVERAILQHANKGGIRLHGLNDFKVALAGFGKDASSYYLNMFPQWDSIQIDIQHGTLNASDIRDDYLRRLPRLPHDACSPQIVTWLKEFSLTPRFKDLVAWKDGLAEDKAKYGQGPFLAADCLVKHRDKILLVTRGKAAGRGQKAIPGGFVEKGERFFDAALREAMEETGLDRETLEEHFAGHWLCDNPDRSLRGRIVSMAFLFCIPDDVDVPAVKAGDDAAHADWYDFASLTTAEFYEDHHSIITNLLKEDHL
jgi:bifunctional NMN adenylyltransferase/nudix hydrolase